MVKYLVFVSLLLFGGKIFAQQIDSLYQRNDTIDYTQILNKYLNNTTPQTKVDSGFINSYAYLEKFFNDTSASYSLSRVKGIINSNRIQLELLQLNAFRNKADSLNQERQMVLGDYWRRQNLQHRIDTGEISTEDTMFFSTLEALMYQDTLNLDSILQVLSPYSDTLVMAVDALVSKYKNHEYTRWIKGIRNDTVSIYLVNIEGDSLPVRLYKNNPRLIRFGLTDYWGGQFPAVIRNIDKRSFKIFIEDGPETDYNTDDKAKEVLYELGKSSSSRVITIKPILVEIPKPTWSLGGNSSIDLSQVGMYSWAAGGDPSITVTAGLELFAKYKKDKQNWDNFGKFRYGVIRQGRYSDTTVHFKSNEDLIEVSSKYGYKVFGLTYLTFEGDFKSQFAPTYDWNGNEKGAKVSDFMNPGFLTFSLGLDYKPNDNATFFAAPVTSKSTYILDDDVVIKSKYGVDTTKNVRFEIGARIKLNYKTKIGKIEINNSLELFSNYLQNPQNIDVNCEIGIVLPVNDFIRARITTNFIYDDDTKVPKYGINEDGIEEKYDGKGPQFREIIAIGASFKF